MSQQFSELEQNKLKDMLLVYEWGQKMMLTKMQILFDSLAYFQNNSPIEHIKHRIKGVSNIAEKLCRLNLELSAENAVKHLQDIAGIRIICSYAKDIFYLVDMIKSIPGTKLLAEKDYISKPKESGYRSFHLILEIEVFYSGMTERLPIEVQLRTAAMDFWASLEHKVRYKYKDHIPKQLNDELVSCADKIAELDDRMYLIHDIINLINQS